MLRGRCIIDVRDQIASLVKRDPWRHVGNQAGPRRIPEQIRAGQQVRHRNIVPEMSPHEFPTEFVGQSEAKHDAVANDRCSRPNTDALAERGDGNLERCEGKANVDHVSF